MANYGSVDYGNLASHIEREKNYSNISNHETLYKKASHQNLIGMMDK